ncbi:MAG TPA: hypothetical protein VGG72_16550 [Bryobacteraceae bacterium]
MIWRLIRLDPEWKWIPWLAAANALIWWFAGGIGGVSSFTTELTFIPLIILPGLRNRYTLLGVTLPISGKQLFLSRIALLLAFIWVPLLAALAVLLVRGNRIWAESLTMLEFGAVATVGILLVQSVRVRAMNPPMWIGIPVLAAVFVSLLVMEATVFPGSAAFIAAVLGGATLVSAGLFMKAWTEVPKSFQLAPAEPVAVRSERTGTASNHGPWWPVFRALYFGNWKNGSWLFALLFFAFASATLGSPMAPFAILYIPMSSLDYRRRTRWLLHLPISARKLLWMVWFPATAAILAGLTLHAAINWAELSDFGLSKEAAVTLESPWGVHVPSGYWRWARAGAAPAIEAPWGEGHRPEMQKVMGVNFYNPYSAGGESSRQFLEWQFLRATQAVYGRAIPVSGAEELGRMKTILEQPKAQIVLSAIVLVYYLFEICALNFSGWKRVRNVHLALRLIPASLPLLLFPLALMQLRGSRGGGLVLDAMLLHLGRVLPDNLWMLTLIAGVSIAALGWLADKLWRENEFGQVESLARNYKPQD